MHIFARGGHGGHGAGALKLSDFVSTVNGHSVYHLIPILIFAAVILGGLTFLWINLFLRDYSTITLPPGCLPITIAVLVLIAITCTVLSFFPNFVWF